MRGLAGEARSWWARVAELIEASKKNASKLMAKRRAADMKVVVEQEGTDYAELTALISQLESDLHEVKSKLDF